MVVTDMEQDMARKGKPIRTARCVLRLEDRYLLVVHRGRLRNPGWGLPGGHVEREEDALETVRRELWEELYLRPEVFVSLGDYRYRGHAHRVFGCDVSESPGRFDRSELLRIGWYSCDGVAELAARGKLHAGYEIDAVRRFAAISGK